MPTYAVGVLKARTLRFEPPLPRWKVSAIERLGFGTIEKVYSCVGFVVIMAFVAGQ
jgi:hypothetical protein